MWQGTEGGLCPIANKEVRSSFYSHEELSSVINHRSDLGRGFFSIEPSDETPKVDYSLVRNCEARGPIKLCPDS